MVRFYSTLNSNRLGCCCPVPNFSPVSGKMHGSPKSKVTGFFQGAFKKKKNSNTHTQNKNSTTPPLPPPQGVWARPAGLEALDLVLALGVVQAPRRHGLAHDHGHGQHGVPQLLSLPAEIGFLSKENPEMDGLLWLPFKTTSESLAC